MGDIDAMKEKGADARRKIREEILSTEESYVSGLTILRHTYCKAVEEMKGKESNFNASSTDISALLINIETLENLHSNFLQEMKDKDPSEFPRVIADYCKLMCTCYMPYMAGYESALEIIDKLMKKSKKFKALMTKVDEDIGKESPGKRYLDYLITPVQRLPRYVLLLGGLIENSSEGHPQYTLMTDTYDKIKNVATVINEGKREREQKNKLLQVSSLMHGAPNDFELVAPHRIMINNGSLTVYNESFHGKTQSLKKVTRNLFLFSDILMILKSDHTYKYHISIAAATVEAIPEKAEDFSIQSNKMYALFQCETSDERDKWVSVLKDTIAKAKKTANG